MRTNNETISNVRKSTDPNTPYGTFTVLVRGFSDTDTGPQILEQYSQCTLDPNSADYEVWNNFTISDMSIRYVRGTVYWAPVGGNTVLNGGHPDNNQYNDFRNNDPDYNNLDDGGAGGNKSWHRFGVAGQFQLAYDELGWANQRSTVSSIYIGRKTGYFAGNVSRNNQGNDENSFIDMGESSSGRVFRWSSGNEGGAPPNERFAWSPYDIWLS